MARVSGWDSASVTFASAPGIVLHVKDMNIDESAAEIDVSAFGDGQAKRFIPGEIDATLSINGVLDSDSAIPAPGASAAAISIVLYTGQTVAGSGFWTRLSKSSSRTAENRIAGTFRFTGDLTRVP